MFSGIVKACSEYNQVRFYTLTIDEAHFAIAIGRNGRAPENAGSAYGARHGQSNHGFAKSSKKKAKYMAGEMFRKPDQIMEVNAEVLNNPPVLRQDPYGKGWLLSVHVPDEENTGRNLVPKGLIRQWMQDAVERLYSMQPALAGAVAPDGGRPAEDVVAALEVDWKAATGEFFLTL